MVTPPSVGIIPARAGFTLRCRSTLVAPGDHPRSRGVYITSFFSNLWNGGSSPLARGLRPDHDDRRPRARIIPARAGFTLLNHDLGVATWDHPRSRGVYSRVAAQIIRAQGSSPLARGLHNHSLALRRIYGIIPARAGFTRKVPLTMMA